MNKCGPKNNIIIYKFEDIVIVKVKFMEISYFKDVKIILGRIKKESVKVIVGRREYHIFQTTYIKKNKN